jgi:hypothetical protein
VNKTVSSVIDDINEWENPRGGSVFYVTAMFTDETVGSVGRKDHDAALEVQGLLREAIGVEQDFTLEAKGWTKTGREKFRITGFGTPGGAATYTAPGVQGNSGSTAPGNSGRPGPARGTRPPEPSSEQASIRASVALKAAVDTASIIGKDFGALGICNTVLEYADAFNAWMLEKTSEPALSAYPSTDSPSVTPAGAGSESTSGEGHVESDKAPDALSPEPSDSAGVSEPTLIGAESESGGGVATEGKEPAPPPHDKLWHATHGDPQRTPPELPHEHDWQAHPNLHGWLTCSCGENRKKYAP